MYQLHPDRAISDATDRNPPKENNNEKESISDPDFYRCKLLFKNYQLCLEKSDDKDTDTDTCKEFHSQFRECMSYI